MPVYILLCENWLQPVIGKGIICCTQAQKGPNQNRNEGDMVKESILTISPSFLVRFGPSWACSQHCRYGG